MQIDFGCMKIVDILFQVISEGVVKNKIKFSTIVIVLVFSALIAICMLTAQDWQTLFRATTVAQAEIAPPTPSYTFTVTHMPATGVATPTATPYVIVYNGFINCRRAPSTSMEVLTVIKGDPITIIRQNQGGDWLLVKVHNYDTPCWINRNILNSYVTTKDISRVPTFVITVNLTFTLPPP